MTITLTEVQSAAAAIRGYLVETPCLHSRTLSQITGAEVYLKFENHAVHRDLQRARRAEQTVIALEREKEARRDRRLGRQPRARCCLSRQAPRRSGTYRHAALHAQRESRSTRAATAPK